MVFDFLKKKDSVPDVGQEEVYDEKKKKKEDSFKNKLIGKLKKPIGGKDEKIDSGKVGVKDDSGVEKAGGVGEVKPVVGTGSGGAGSFKNNLVNENTKLEISKINARIEAINALLKGFNERFSNASQQIGEVRSMILSNEKSVSKMSLEGRKAADLVKEVKPEKLRLDYQRFDLKLTTLGEKLEGTKQFSETIMNEVKDLRRKAGVFVGTDALLKLNEEVKKDLVELQRIGARVRVNADKSEQLFVELRRGFAENQKLNEVFNNLDNAYANMQKDVEKFKIDFSNVVNKSDFNDFQKKVQDRILASENTLSGIGKVKEENERLADLIETILAVSKKNEDDIADIAVTIGDENIKKVSDYDERFNLVLKIMDEIIDEIKRIKGVPVSKKVFKKPVAEKVEEQIKKPKLAEESSRENLLGISKGKVDKWATKNKEKAPEGKSVVDSGKTETDELKEVEEKDDVINVEKTESSSVKKPEGSSVKLGAEKMSRIDNIKSRIKELINAKTSLKDLKGIQEKERKLAKRIVGRKEKSELAKRIVGRKEKSEEVRSGKIKNREVGRKEKNESTKKIVGRKEKSENIKRKKKSVKKIKEKSKVSRKILGALEKARGEKRKIYLKKKREEKREERAEERVRKKRLKSLEKARGVKHENFEKREKIKKQRLKNLAKARRVRKKKRKI